MSTCYVILIRPQMVKATEGQNQESLITTCVHIRFIDRMRQTDSDPALRPVAYVIIFVTRSDKILDKHSLKAIYVGSTLK